MKSKKKFLKIFCAFLLVFAGTSLLSQAQSTHTRLQDKDWVMQISTSKFTVTGRFTPIELITTVTDKNGDDVQKEKYYLSDTEEETFDIKKLGKVAEGKFIISQNALFPDKLIVYEIIKLTNDELELKDMSKDGVIIPCKLKK